MNFRTNRWIFASCRQTRSRRCAGVTGATVALLGALLTALPHTSAQSAAPPIVKTTDLPGTVGEAFLRLIDQSLSLAERRAAAMSLLNVGNKESVRALNSVLTEGASPIAWRAVAEAVALHPKDPPAELANPMLALLTKADGSTQAALAEGLGRFRQPELVEQLASLASDGTQSTDRRRGAILALGQELYFVQMAVPSHELK